MFVADALSEKERIKPLRVKIIVMTIFISKLTLSNFLKATNDALKGRKKSMAENLRGIDKAFDIHPDVNSLYLETKAGLPLFGNVEIGLFHIRDSGNHYKVALGVLLLVMIVGKGWGKTLTWSYISLTNNKFALQYQGPAPL
ncbi:hypothetical protein Tco_0209342 [Tanacetum coccineum]